MLHHSQHANEVGGKAPPPKRVQGGQHHHSKGQGRRALPAERDDSTAPNGEKRASTTNETEEGGLHSKGGRRESSTGRPQQKNEKNKNKETKTHLQDTKKRDLRLLPPLLRHCLQPRSVSHCDPDSHRSDALVSQHLFVCPASLSRCVIRPSHQGHSHQEHSQELANQRVHLLQLRSRRHCLHNRAKAGRSAKAPPAR